jgi:hypothetical protein
VEALMLEAAGLALRARAERLTKASVARSRTIKRSIVLTWSMRGTFGWLHPVAIQVGLVVSTWKLRRSDRPAHLEVRSFGPESTAFPKAGQSEAGGVERHLETKRQLRFESL